ncbi:hypothetical protein H0H93_011980 [Arthromyces matolae]|nr:hypothetical protein H0H93_011980 [Arthromyces matolae]
MRTPKSDRQERLITTDGLRDALICFAKDLINVDKLDIRWEPSKSAIRKQNPLCPVLSIFLPTFGSNLRTLSIVLPNSVATSLLPTMAVSFKDLQELRIDLLRDDFGWAPPISLPTLLPMINGVSRTLRSLWISAPGVGGSSSAFFEGFSQFPCLNRLHLKNTMNFSDVQYDLFLPLSSDDHRHRLIVAAEQPLGTQWIGQWRSFRAVVVEAEGLDGIDAAISSSRTTRIDALCRASSSLVALEPALKYYEIKGLISHFSSLERLTLTVENFTPELLDFLVESCRSLTHLCVEIQRTSSSSEFNAKLYDEVSQYSPSNANFSIDGLRIRCVFALRCVLVKVVPSTSLPVSVI